MSCGSRSVTHVAVKGTPSFALKIAPSSHPDVTHAAGPDRDFGPGTCQVALRTTVRRMSKSESARLEFRSYQGKLDSPFENVSPAMLPEPLSMLFPQVNDPWNWRP